MPDIRRLPPSVVNKIAAGEVIERAASVAKELMENSIDAGASRVDVTVEGGGSELVRVVDNGCGIAAEQLVLAVASHATSKIRDADDLFRVGTLGFRGEALASIAEVSRLVLRSRPAEAAAGAELEVVGGEAGALVPCGCPVGTTIEVRQLFFNTPVRRKFLKTPQTELAHVTEAFTRLALAHPAIHFHLRHNQRNVYDLPPAANWAERIGRFFGHDLAENLIAVESQEGSVRLAGYVAHPSHSRSHPRMQYLFLNGRYIRDRALQHALSEAYRGLLLTGRYPISFLWIEMPPEVVDVNVHPTKLEVRFQDGGRLYSQLLGTLRTKFLTTDLTARLEPAPERPAAAALDPQRAAQLRQELVDWAKGELAQVTPAAVSANPAAAPSLAATGSLDSEPARFAHFASPTRRPLELAVLSQPAEELAGGTLRDDDEDDEDDRHEDRRGHLRAVAETVPLAALPPDRPLQAMQVHNRYLIAESAEGVVVIDQHALHERILYESLRNKVLAGSLEAQQLLVPEPVELSGPERAAVEENRPVLARLGLVVEPFGGQTVLVHSYPAMLGGARPGEVLRGLVEQLLAGGKTPDGREMLDELLHTIACKAAIKAGDRLAPEEIESLVAQRHLVQDSHHCPHGRPTALVFTREELDRQFKRT